MLRFLWPLKARELRLCSLEKALGRPEGGLSVLNQGCKEEGLSVAVRSPPAQTVLRFCG